MSDLEQLERLMAEVRDERARAERAEAQVAASAVSASSASTAHDAALRAEGEREGAEREREACAKDVGALYEDPRRLRYLLGEQAWQDAIDFAEQAIRARGAAPATQGGS